ncbi:MAG: PAS domain-containing protein, partial [Phormidium sp.]
VDRTTSVKKVAQLIIENQVSSVVITAKREPENIVPIGVVTERQIVQAWALGIDIAQTPASLIMRRLGQELNPTNSLLYAYQQMQSDRMDTLLVSEGKSELSGGQWGIITAMELLRSLEPMQIYRRLKRTQQFAQQLQVEKAQLLSRRNAELTEQVQQQTEKLRQESEKLKQQVQQAKLINQITQAMRGTLVLDEIFQTTVNQLHEALKVSRCLIFHPNTDNQFAVHHVSEATCKGSSLIGLHCNFYQLYDAQLSQGKPLILPEINSSFPTEIQEAAQGCKIRAIMIMPLIYQQTYIGGISLHQCDRQREWTEDEVDFVKAIADHCAIAIHQAKLYQELQTELQERQKAEAALRKQKQFLQDVIDTNPNLIFVKDWQGRFVLANQACADILGINVEQMLGKTDGELNPTLGERQQFNPDDQEVMTTRKTKFISEEPLTNVTGEVRWLQTVKKPLLSSDGQTIQLLGVATDITERKRAETALQELNSQLESKVAERTEQLNQIIRGLAKEIVQHQRTEVSLQQNQAQLQAILDNLPAVMYVYDTQDRYLLINRQYETLFNVKKEEIVGQTVYDFWSPEIADLFATNNRLVREHGTALHTEEIAPHEDSLHTYITVKFPLKDSDGEIYAVCGISTDITDRK